MPFRFFIGLLYKCVNNRYTLVMTVTLIMNAVQTMNYLPTLLVWFSNLILKHVLSAKLAVYNRTPCSYFIKE